jgi:hypothetical protein
VDIESMLGRMTLEEKCAQLGSVFSSIVLIDGDLDEAP